ncbi:MAG: Rieske 2Fe-2S domain-containing protein [Bryobacteraceae bacterium]
MSDNTILSAIEKQEWLQPIQEKGEELVKSAYGAAGPAGQTVKNTLHGVWLGHPLHPAITDVPVGSWTAALVLDYMESQGNKQYAAGADAAVAIGLVGAVGAALSGITDWSDTHGKPQRVGAVHGMLNSVAAVLYTGSYIARKKDKRGLGRGLGYLGYALVLGSAYLGGELSYGQRIGVDHAADADEEFPKEFTPVCSESDLQEDKPKKVTWQETDIFLLKRGTEIYAMGDKCAHLGGPLSEGKIEGDTVQCPWHGSRFCLKDGSVENGPATNNQPVLDVTVEGGQVLVRARRD